MNNTLEHAIAASSGLIAYLAVYRLVRRRHEAPQHAVCVFDRAHSGSVSGSVQMSSLGDGTTRFVCSIVGLTPGLHGFHIHTYGDLREGCKSACDHYNPWGRSHGGTHGYDRHVGDLGNLIVNEQGVCSQIIVAEVRVDQIIGRMLVIHENEDDLGMTQHPDSLKTGNSGARVACGVVGRCAQNKDV